jgi:hypothetical protein
MTLMLAGLDPLDPLKRSVAVLYAQGEDAGRDEATGRLDDRLAAIGAPVVVPRPPLILDDQFPAQLFHTAPGRLERLPAPKAADPDSRIAWQAARHVARTARSLPASREQEGSV